MNTIPNTDLTTRRIHKLHKTARCLIAIEIVVLGVLFYFYQSTHAILLKHLACGFSACCWLAFVALGRLDSRLAKAFDDHATDEEMQHLVKTHIIYISVPIGVSLFIASLLFLDPTI